MKKRGPSRRMFLGMAAGGAVARTGITKFALRPKRIVELVPHAASGTVRLIERVVWVVR